MIVFVVVMYNIRLSECLTLRTLRNAVKEAGMLSGRILVLDNSKVPLEPYVDGIGYDYVSFGENAGLARAYKYGVDYCIKHGAAFMATLDQDSEVTSEYIAATATHTDRYRDQNVALCPRIMCAGRQISPYSLNAFGSPRFGSTGKLYAINSFSVYPVSSLACANVIDEFYWLDGLDFAIFENLHRNEARVVSMPVEVQHSLSLLQGRVNHGRLANIAYFEAAFLFEYCGPVRSAAGLARLFVRLARRTDFTKLGNGFWGLLKSTVSGSFRGLGRRLERRQIQGIRA